MIPLKSSRFALLAASASASLLGYAGFKVLVGWLILELTSSVFLVALSFALLLLPRLIFGLHLGALVDRIDRRAAAALCALLSGAVSLLLAPMSGQGSAVGALLIACFVLGLLEALRVIAIMTLVYGVVRPTDATAAVALANFFGNLGQALGALLFGVLLEQFGSAATLLGIAGAYLAGGMLLFSVRRSTVPIRVSARIGEGDTHGEDTLGLRDAQGAVRASGLRGTRAWRAAAAPIGFTTSDPQVRLLAWIGVMIEVLGFSSSALFPILARDVYRVGASGLGVMNFSRSVGAAVGLLALLWAATRFATLHRGFLYVALATLFGIALVALAFAQGYLLAVFILFVMGSVVGSLDALLQTLLQAATRRRGSAMGVWVWTVGFAPIGQLQTGIIGTVLGAQLALGINGSILALAGVLLALLPATRRLR
jgi:MFS family permease